MDVCMRKPKSPGKKSYNAIGSGGSEPKSPIIQSGETAGSFSRRANREAMALLAHSLWEARGFPYGSPKKLPPQ
jgi:hypothetical protein